MARDFSIRVDRAPVQGTRHFHLLGVTFDRQLHFGEHCGRLRRKVKPRTAQLRKLTGRSWGLREPQLRTVANGYVRGALEYAAAAWLPAALESHVEIEEQQHPVTVLSVTFRVMSSPTTVLTSDLIVVEKHVDSIEQCMYYMSAAGFMSLI